MHAVYFVRPGENEELRYSLRSLQKYGDVEHLTIVGDAPKWAIPNTFIQGNPRGGDKYHNVMANLTTAYMEYPEDFVIFNDDFYLLSPLENLPLYYGYTLAQHTMMCDTRFPEGRLRRTHMNTMDMYLKARGASALSFEVHVPIPVNGSVLEAVIHEFWDETNDGVAAPLSWRSLYGNLAVQPKEPRKDTVAHGIAEFNKAEDFVSTADRSVDPIFGTLQAIFPDPSRWES